ncbi:MAG: HAD family phosphatase, partial [Deltaproteobacteria bacterium]|nr:HAD family phosphatase [Deltaproteobacteria bacterium]
INLFYFKKIAPSFPRYLYKRGHFLFKPTSNLCYALKLMSLQAVISDLDGIIVNSEHYHFLSFKRLLKEDYNIEYTKEDDRHFLGTTDIYVFNNLKARHPHLQTPLSELISKRTHLYIEIFKHEAKPLPGIIDFFQYLQEHHIPLAIGTAASRGVTEFIAQILNLKKWIQFYVCADDVVCGKPAPDIYLKCAEKLGIPPKNMLVIEDSVHGEQAAKAAGMKCIAIPCGPTVEQDHSLADWVLTSATELTPEIIQRLFQ